VYHDIVMLDALFYRIPFCSQNSEPICITATGYGYGGHFSKIKDTHTPIIEYIKNIIKVTALAY
jgi:hypothetical protein